MSPASVVVLIAPVDQVASIIKLMARRLSIYIYIHVRTLRASVHIQVTMGIVSVYKGEKLGVMYKGELTLQLGSFRMAAN